MTPYSKKVKCFFDLSLIFFVAPKKFSKNRRKPALFILAFWGIFATWAKNFL